MLYSEGCKLFRFVPLRIDGIAVCAYLSMECSLELIKVPKYYGPVRMAGKYMDVVKTPIEMLTPSFYFLTTGRLYGFSCQMHFR